VLPFFTEVDKPVYTNSTLSEWRTLGHHGLSDLREAFATLPNRGT